MLPGILRYAPVDKQVLLATGYTSLGSALLVYPLPYRINGPQYPLFEDGRKDLVAGIQAGNFFFFLFPRV